MDNRPSESEFPSVGSLLRELAACADRPWTLMTVGGEAMHSVVPASLPSPLNLTHAPLEASALVPAGVIDKAIEIAQRPATMVCAPEELLSLPGTELTLAQARDHGARVCAVTSPLAALAQAREQRNVEFVFVAGGFERAAVATALTMVQAQREGLRNLTLLVAHMPFPTAVALTVASAATHAQAFVLPAEECALLGADALEPLAGRHGVPIAIAELLPAALLDAMLACVKDLKDGRHGVLNRCPGAVSFRGDLRAQRILRETFRLIPARWRHHGLVPRSGLGLRVEHHPWDAEHRFGPVEPARERAEEPAAAPGASALYSLPEGETAHLRAAS